MAPPRPATQDDRWFVPRIVENGPGAVLVERHVSIPLIPDPKIHAMAQIQNLVPELQSTSIRDVTCSSYKWDEATFQYRRIPGTPEVCRSPSEH